MKWWLSALSLALIGCALISCARTAAPPLPEPQTGSFTPAVRTKIDKALADARARPDDAAAGHLGMLLDAHEQYEAAASAYRRAAFLAPAVFDWPYLLGCVRAAQGRNDEAAVAFEKSLRVRDSAVARESTKNRGAGWVSCRLKGCQNLYPAQRKLLMTAPRAMEKRASHSDFN